MTERSSRRGLDSLFDLAEPSADWTDEDLAAMLRHQLDAPCDLDSSFPSIRALLDADNPPVEALESLKRLAKVRRTQQPSSIPPDLWRVIYFASIAVAIRHRYRISELSPPDLLGGFRWALSRPWLEPSVRDLIQSAARVTSSASQ